MVTYNIDFCNRSEIRNADNGAFTEIEKKTISNSVNNCLSVFIRPCLSRLLDNDSVLSQICALRFTILDRRFISEALSDLEISSLSHNISVLNNASRIYISLLKEGLLKGLYQTSIEVNLNNEEKSKISEFLKNIIIELNKSYATYAPNSILNNSSLTDFKSKESVVLEKNINSIDEENKNKIFVSKKFSPHDDKNILKKNILSKFNSENNSKNIKMKNFRVRRFKKSYSINHGGKKEVTTKLNKLIENKETSSKEKQVNFSVYDKLLNFIKKKKKADSKLEDFSKNSIKKDEGVDVSAFYLPLTPFNKNKITLV